MNLAQFVDYLKDLGVRIVSRDGQLTVEGRTDVLDADLIEKIRANKTTLLTLLKRGLESSDVISPRLAGETETHWPLSYAQQRLWFLEQFEPGQAFYNMPAALRLNGNLNVAALSDTFNEILRRHEALRTSFAMVDDSPMQVINPSLTLSLPVLDLSSLLPAEREAQAHWLAQDEAQTAFDLSNGPLIRGRLIKLAQDEHILLFTMHHIVSDGWSMTVLVNELASLYAAFAAGQASPLAELPIQYADYALWQRQWLSGDVLEQQLRYWQGQLTGAPTLLSLPTDRPRPMVQSHRGATKGFRIEAASTASLLSLCKQTQSTLFMSLAAVFNILLCRYAQQNDICLGTVIANRNRGEVEGLIGFFVNTLVLRTQVDGLERFSDLLKRVRSTALEAYAHQDVPFEQLVEAVKPERHTSHSPLFQVMLVLQNTPKGALTLPQLTLQPVVTERTSSKFDLTLYATEGSTELQCAFEYNTDLFDEATVERMARHFTTLLQAAVADPDMIVRDLPMLEEAERQQLLVEWNGTAQDYAGERTVHQLFEAQAAKTPDSAALVFEDQALTYAEVNARANRLAHHLRGQGVGPDVLVGLCIERAPDMIVGLLGILKAGGAYVPLDPAYPQDRLAYMLEDAQPALLLTQARYRDTLPGNVATFCLDSQWQELETNDTNPENRTQAGNLAYVIYTSGSTGKPKGVLGSVGGLRNRLMWMQASFPYGAGTNYLQKTSISFIDSLTETLGPLLFGGCLHIAGSAIAGDPQRLGQLIEREQIARLVLVPSLLKSMVQSEEGGIKSGITPGLDMIVCSGEALPSSLAQLCRDTSILNLYGSSEGTGDSTWHLCDGTSSDRDMIPIGRPIANTEIYLLDSAHNPVPVGVAGELHIAGAGLARGYLNRAGLTAEKFVPNPYGKTAGARMYKTGDLARYLPDGSIDYLGRIDNQVKVRGFRIELGEIESALRAAEQVAEAVVVAREDEPGDKRLVAYVVPASLDVSQLRQALQQHLPDYMMPAYFVTLDALPLTPNGKVDRKALPAPEARRNEGGYVAPRTPAEEILAGIWAEVLKLDKVGVEDNFFELGGHSLLATQLASKVRAVFATEVPLRALFEAPTVALLAQRMAQLQEEQGALAAPAIVPVERNGEQARHWPLSYAQQRLWFLEQFEPGQAFYNMPAALRLNGNLNVAALSDTFNEILRRHEALRTSFAMVDDSPMQVINPSLTLSLPVLDLSSLLPAEREAQAHWLAQDEAQTAFDLSNGPLIRGRLIKLAQDEHILLFTMHHIVSDGWSMTVLVNELASLYAAFAAGQASPLAELPIQYADYALWQRQWLSGDVLEQQLRYWQGQLTGAPTLLSLPTDRPRPMVQSHRGATKGFRIEAASTASLLSLCKQTQSTLFMSLAAVFNILLCRYAQQNDICLGTVIANRNRGEVEGLIGFFVNTLVLRTQVDGLERFSDLLKRVRSTALEAYAHQDVPFEQLVEAVKPERHTSHSPLFQVMLVLQNTPKGALTLPQLTLQPVVTERTSSKFDLTLYATEGSTELQCAFEYNTDLFDEATVERMARHFTTLLQAAVADPDMIVRDLPMLEEAERQQLLVEWNGTGEAYPREQTIHQLFEQQVGKTPGKVAVVFEEETLSYAELNARANRLAHYLRSQGVGPDVLVGICVERSLDMIVGLLAILKAGGAYVPLDPAYPQDRLATMLDDAKPAVLLTQEHLRGTLPSDVATFCLDSQWPELEAKDTNPEHQTQAGNLAYVIYTSGSTGKPKGALLQHYNVTRLFLATEDKFHFSQADTWTMFHSYAFDFSVWEIWGALLYGGKLIVVPYLLSRSTEQFHALLAQEQVTILNQTPSAFRQLMEVDLKQADPTNPADHPALHLRHVIFGGEALNASMLTPWVQKHGAAGPGLINMYGITETTVHVTYLQVQDDTPSAASIGRPISDLSAFILDGAMNPVPIGVAGELHIAGDGLARGYLNLPGLTAERFVANPYGSAGSRMYKSGDLARYLPDGSIEYLGRIDSQVKIRGFRIEPGEIEAALTAQEDVSEALVLAREDEGGKRLVAYVVAEEQATVDGAQLREVLLQSLPDYMVPSYFVMLERFPLTSNGKIDRKALPAPEMRRSVTGYVAPANDLEMRLAEIWKQNLQVDRIGVADNYFSIGGDSIRSIALVAQAKQAGIEFQVKDLFANPTIQELGKAIDAGILRHPQAEAPQAFDLITEEEKRALLEQFS